MSKPKSDLVKALDDLQSKLWPKLKALGFRMRARAFNRTSADELTQVVQLQMGRFDPPGTTYIPGLRENLYGKFTLNIGVYVPEVALHHGSGKIREFVQDYHCCIRTRLGTLGPDCRDVWWNVHRDDHLEAELWNRLERDAFPFLMRFDSREAILREWMDVPHNVDLSSPPRIVCAIILAARGENADARRLLVSQARETRNPGHSAYVRALSKRLGLGDIDV